MKARKQSTGKEKSDSLPGSNADGSQFDSALASLFESSAGPVIKPLPKRYENSSIKAASETIKQTENDVTDGPTTTSSNSATPSPEPTVSSAVGNSRRKRKARSHEEEIEDVYLRRLSQGAYTDTDRAGDSQARKRPRVGGATPTDSATDKLNSDTRALATESDPDDEMQDGDFHSEAGSNASERPIHESLMPDKSDTEIEKASRTVFLGNVSNLAIVSKAARRELTAHISAVVQSDSLPDGKSSIQSLRFRSTAYANTIPKKGAFAKKDLMDATTKSTNAYAVYRSEAAARKAAKALNGTVILDRHLRADLVAHPAKTDHRRCVFVGNLGFVDDESSINAAEEDDNGDKHNKRKNSKNKEPGDVEEGLWREFGKAGEVESVRVIRDPKTRVGKGFAYVQFIDENAVEEAILYDGKKFPPLLPRKLRVFRAKGMKRTTGTKTRSSHGNIMNSKTRKSLRGEDPKINPRQRSLAGRAGNLLGKGGAATLRRSLSKSQADDVRGFSARPQRTESSAKIKAPGNFVFEGHRASRNQRPTGLKLTKKGKTKGQAKKSGKPKTRSANRAAAWKAGRSKRS